MVVRWLSTGNAHYGRSSEGSATRDFPDHYVVREWRVGAGLGGQPEHFATTFDTLDQARDSLPPGLTRLERQAGDDPVIVESWL